MTLWDFNLEVSAVTTAIVQTAEFGSASVFVVFFNVTKLTMSLFNRQTTNFEKDKTFLRIAIIATVLSNLLIPYEQHSDTLYTPAGK